MNVTIESLNRALDHAKGGAAYHDLSRRVWSAWGAGMIGDRDAEILQSRIDRRRPREPDARDLGRMTAKVMRDTGLDRQRPLSVRFETKHHWQDLRDEFGVSKTGGAILLDLCDVPVGSAPDPVTYSRYNKFYDRPGRYKNPIFTYRKVVGAFDQLEAMGAITQWISSPKMRGWQSHGCATDETVAKVRSIIGNDPLPLAGPVEPIELRSADKSKLDYRESRERQRDRRTVEMLNEVIGAARIEGTRVGLLRRIYNENFSRGGRFYAMGGGWQVLNEEQRAEIRINGEPVAELDYVSMHPMLIYAMAGKTPPAEIYRIGAWPRDLVKLAMLVIVNAETKADARAALAYSDGTAEDPTKRERALMQSLAEPGSPEAFGLASKLMADIDEFHAPIREAFYSGMGARLMAIDSGIAARVMSLMAKQGVTCLPVHDSFLVPQSKAGLLHETMIKAAHEAGFSALSVK